MERPEPRYLTSAQVRTRYGGISDMSLWRWSRDPRLAFPQPRRINGRRYYDLADLDAFDARLANAEAAA